MKRKNKNIKIIISIIIIVVLLLKITSRILDDKKELNFFEKTIKDSIVFVEKIFYSPISYIKDKIEISKETKDLYKKYTKLKEKEEKTEIYYSQIKELQKELAQLKSLLDLNATLSEYSYVNATVITRNVMYWYNTLTIDKGSKNGIKKDDAVITSNGLIGKIIKVSNFSSTVKLLTTENINNKISIKINSNETELYGLLYSYDSNNNVYKIEGIEDASSISKGDYVTTTGLTNYFPSGILIGHVSRVIKDEYDLNSVVEVTPSVNFDNISFVTVLNRKASRE